MSNAAWRLAEASRNAALAEAKAFREANEDALPYQVIPMVKVVRKRPPGYHNIPVAVVERFLGSPQYLSTTNEAILEGLAAKWAPHPLPKNLMDKGLSAAQLRAVAAVLAKAGLAFDPKAHKSLSKIKRLIQAGNAAADAELSYTATITFGSDCLTVGSKRFPFKPDANGFSRIKVGTQKLRVDVLQALLEAGNLPSSTS
jgi:hypothetical protein